MKTKLLLLVMGIGLIATSCDQNTYSGQREQENKLIENFFKRNGFNIITEEPKDDIWGEKDYLKVPGYDDFYFHLTSRGDSIRIDSINGKADTIDLPLSYLLETIAISIPSLLSHFKTEATLLYGVV